jgi:hypothetical protein
MSGSISPNSRSDWAGAPAGEWSCPVLADRFPRSPRRSPQPRSRSSCADRPSGRSSGWQQVRCGDSAQSGRLAPRTTSHRDSTGDRSARDYEDAGAAWPP